MAKSKTEIFFSGMSHVNDTDVFVVKLKEADTIPFVPAQCNLIKNKQHTFGMPPVRSAFEATRLQIIADLSADGHCEIAHFVGI